MSCHCDSNETWAMLLKKLDSNQRPMKHFGCCRQLRLAQIMMKNYSDSQNYLSAVFARFGEPKSLLFDNERKVFQNDLIDHRKTQVMRIMLSPINHSRAFFRQKQKSKQSFKT